MKNSKTKSPKITNCRIGDEVKISFMKSNKHKDRKLINITGIVISIKEGFEIEIKADGKRELFFEYDKRDWNMNIIKRAEG